MHKPRTVFEKDTVKFMHKIYADIKLFKAKISELSSNIVMEDITKNNRMLSIYKSKLQDCYETLETMEELDESIEENYRNEDYTK